MTNRAVAVRYARALLDVSVEGGEPERTARELTAFQEMLSARRFRRAQCVKCLSKVKKNIDDKIISVKKYIFVNLQNIVISQNTLGKVI